MSDSKIPRQCNESEAQTSTNDNRTNSEVPASRFSMSMVDISTSSNGLTTFGYERVLRNRIPVELLRKGDRFDIDNYKPTFLHDIMMFPGSLSALIGKNSEDVLSRMTPAILPGFRAHVHRNTLHPCVFESTDSDAYMHGIVIFGLGRKARRLIHKHYSPHAKRKRVQVEVEVVIKSFSCSSDNSYRLQRRQVQAHAWTWSDQTTPLIQNATWTIEKCLEGRLRPEQTSPHSLLNAQDSGIDHDNSEMRADDFEG